jgi:transcriptional regulator with XRE-family HTH domain
MIDSNTLASMLKARGWSQSELARRVGVSRQAVSLWFRVGVASVRSSHLFKVSEALEVPAESVARPLPGFGKDHDRLKATFLWDSLYPDLDDFAIAVNAWRPEAVARLVQVSGMYVSERLLGVSVWRRFDEYGHYIHPVRRQQLKDLIRWRTSQTAS